MGTLQGILEIGKRALNANRENLGVIGHNVSNVNTEGYSRQRANLSSTKPLNNIHYGQVGTGVEVSEITRARDRLLDGQVRSESSVLGNWEKRDAAMLEIQNIFNDPADAGFSDILSDFWDGWSDLANDPESYSARSVLRERATVLTDMLNKYDADLKLIENKLNDELKLMIDDVNAIAVQIAQLNKGIRQAESIGQNANDLRDHRDLAVDNLSKMLKVQYTDNENGTVNIYLSGQMLVQDTDCRELTTRVSSRHDMVVDDIIWSDSFSEVEIGGGKLKGLIDVRDVEAEKVRDSLDDFAETLISRVNELHQDGYGLAGSSSQAFFNENNTSAGGICLSSAVMSNLDNIAAGKTAAPGDNSNALDIAALADELLMNNGRETLDDNYASIMADIGAQKQNAEIYLEQSQAVSTQLVNSRQSIQGVVLDEEITEMIKFQQAYQASAMIVNMVDEMMTTVINLGR
ncbi:MAG: flagellar hook-associated protein FlgK [candidate division Zixibacteria bacterium]|nr:flagellar hook-associated protein FlgK [Candidatus Tariuqbacter arcticus]